MTDEKANQILKEWQGNLLQQLQEYKATSAAKTHSKIYNFVRANWSPILPELNEDGSLK